MPCRDLYKYRVDCIVINKNTQSNSNFGFMMSGSRSMGYGYGTSRSASTSVGDLVFMHDGKPKIIFNQIPDAQGVLKLVKSAQR